MESLTRRTLVSQTWRLVLDAWPAGASLTLVPLPFSPVRGVPAVRVFDALGEATVIASQSFLVETVRGDARLRFLAQPPAPGRAAAGIEIDVETGFSPDAEGVPAPLRQAMRLLVARWYENRGDVEADADMARTPASVAALVGPYRRVRLS